MDHDSLDLLQRKHPAWRLLCADHSPLILSFLELSFIKPNRRSMPAPELTAHLEAFLEQLRESHGADRYPKSAREYLETWASAERAWLRKYYPRGGEDAEFDLTPAAERAIEWVRALSPQQFVGTESRLLTLLHLLRDLATGAQQDPRARIHELERRKQDIEREIERIRLGQSSPLDATQIKERYLQAADTARRLLSDFRQVEENFRMLDLRVRERIAVSLRPKGALLQEIFGETDHIRRSDQGKSFEAFWEFLMSPSHQDDLRAWLTTVHQLEAVCDLHDGAFVRDVPVLLLDAGEKVAATVAQLVEQLRRFVDDQVHLENRRILELVRAIESHAIRLKESPPLQGDFAVLDDAAPEFELPLCRVLFRPPKNPVLSQDPVEEARAELDLTQLLAQSSVDEKLLRRQITQLLRTRSQVTLADIIATYPPEQGLAEVVGYLRVAAHDGATIDDTIIETLSLPAVDRDKPTKQVQLPRVIFSR